MATGSLVESQHTPLRLYLTVELGGRFIIGVLKDKLAPNGEVMDRLPKLRESLGTGDEAREVT